MQREDKKQTRANRKKRPTKVKDRKRRREKLDERARETKRYS
jgi:hypothetical protein